MAETFAISRGIRKVDLWCRQLGVLKEGTKFYVINGDWEGILRPDDSVRVLIPATWSHGKRSSTYGDAREVWRGEAPFRDENYNGAMAWIREQLREQPAGERATGELAGGPEGEAAQAGEERP